MHTCTHEQELHEFKKMLTDKPTTDLLSGSSFQPRSTLPPVAHTWASQVFLFSSQFICVPKQLRSLIHAQANICIYELTFV